jgi:hypothetical protein
LWDVEEVMTEDVAKDVAKDLANDSYVVFKSDFVKTAPKLKAKDVAKDVAYDVANDNYVAFKSDFVKAAPKLKAKDVAKDVAYGVANDNYVAFKSDFLKAAPKPKPISGGGSKVAPKSGWEQSGPMQGKIRRHLRAFREHWESSHQEEIKEQREIKIKNSKETPVTRFEAEEETKGISG